MAQLINRQYYTDLIAPFIGKNIIKVLTGQRRVGKSYILKQLSQHILNTDSEANIIFINKEYDDFANIITSDDLSSYINPRLKPDKANFLFIDEVQDVKGFEHTLRSLQAKESCDIFITGSNATMMSSELSTHISRISHIPPCRAIKPITSRLSHLRWTALSLKSPLAERNRL